MGTQNRTAATPEATEYTVREADGEADAYYLQRLWHHWFGSEYDSQETLQRDLFPIAGWTAPDDAEGVPLDAYGAIAEHAPPGHDGSVRIGGGVVLLLDHESTVDELHEGAFDADALVGERNAWLLLGAVDRAWRGRGIGRELLRRRLVWARQMDVEMVFAYGWERRDGATSRPLLEAAGFVPVETHERLYRETARSSCPDCGIWPSDDEACRCDATLWALDGDQI